MVLQIRCSGSPREIGLTHGSQAAAEVAGSISFYAWMFTTSSRLTWTQVRVEAGKFLPQVQARFPRYLEEMKGVAEGAGVPFLDVLALNLRSEIAFGLFSEGTEKPVESDGCTSLSWMTDDSSFLSQNWDRMVQQKPNVIILHVSQPGTELPDFHTITEAGIIGKIGFNAHGVGCCLNAIRARGMDPQRMPIHFGLRTALEAKSRADAIQKIRAAGIASSAYFLLGDATGATGLECSSTGFQEVTADALGRISHANNFLAEHAGVYEPLWLDDSPKRNARMAEIATAEVGKTASLETILDLYRDEENFPTAINRKQEGVSRSETLFNVVFDLKRRTGLVSMGRPTSIDEQVTLSF